MSGHPQQPGFWASKSAEAVPQWHRGRPTARGERARRHWAWGGEAFGGALGAPHLCKPNKWKALWLSGVWEDLHSQLKTFSTWQDPLTETPGPSSDVETPLSVIYRQSWQFNQEAYPLCEVILWRCFSRAYTFLGNHGLYTSKWLKIKALLSSILTPFLALENSYLWI